MKMPRRCWVPNCRSNYDSFLRENNYITTFLFPRDEHLKQEWLRAIPQKDVQPSLSSVVCCKHFSESEIIRYDKFLLPDGSLKQLLLRRPKLKEGVVPSLFENLPSYPSKAPTKLIKDHKARRQEIRQKKSKKISGISRECKKDDESVKPILPQENGCFDEYGIEHVVVTSEGYNEMDETKEYVTQIKEEIEIPELKYSEININENKEKVEPIEYEEVKKEEVTTENKNYIPRCRTCNEKFARYEELNEHYRHNESHKPKRYMCLHCMKSFDYMSELHNHKTEDHIELCSKKNEAVTHVMCELCEKEFSNSSLLKSHMVTHTTEKKFLCEHCGKLFTSQRVLIQHRYLTHELKMGEIPKKYITKRDFKCNICKKMYRTRYGLAMHIKMHKKEYNFLCYFCGRKFLDRSAMDTHIRSHTGSKHECRLCGKYFASKGYLKIHKCVRLNESKSLKVQKEKTCNFCHKKLKKKSGLDRHYHEYVSLTEKKFICGYCNRKYSRICDLNNHRCSNKKSCL